MKKRLYLVISLILISLFLVSGVSAIDITNCSILSVSGNYNLINDIWDNATISYPDTYGVCIAINTSNINLNCNNYTIDNDGQYSNTRGIYITNVENITLKNCNISDFGYGLYSSAYNSIFDTLSIPSGHTPTIAYYLIGFNNTFNKINSSLSGRGIETTTNATNNTFNNLYFTGSGRNYILSESNTFNNFICTNCYQGLELLGNYITLENAYLNINGGSLCIASACSNLFINVTCINAITDYYFSGTCASSNNNSAITRLFWSSGTPLCLGSGVDYSVNYTDIESNAIYLRTDCFGNSSYIISSLSYNPIISCNYSELGNYNAEICIRDYYHTEYSSCKTHYVSVAYTNCYNTGENAGNESYITAISGVSNDFGLYTQDFSNHSGGYTSKTFDYSKCENYTILYGACPLIIWIKGIGTATYNWIFTFFWLFLIFIFILIVIAIIRKTYFNG